MRIRKFNGKTRQDVLAQMYRLANEAIRRDNHRIENVIWGICSDWNGQNPDEEIFMCEKYDDADEELIGFYIEDDYWVYNEYLAG